MKKRNIKIHDILDDLNHRLSNALSYARIITTRLQGFIIHAGFAVAHSSRFFPPIGWMMDSLSLILLAKSPKSRLSTRVKAATLFLASAMLCLGLFAIYTLATGAFLTTMPYIAIAISGIMALSYFALAYQHHFTTSSQDYLNLEATIKGKLAGDVDLSPYKHILFTYYVMQAPGLKNHSLTLDTDKAQSDPLLKTLNHEKCAAFFKENHSTIEKFRESHHFFAQSQSELLSSVIALCSMILAITSILLVTANPAIFGIIITALMISALIKTSQIIPSIQYSWHEWRLTLNAQSQKIYRKMNEKLAFNMSQSIVFTAIILLLTFNIFSPLIALVAITVSSLIIAIPKLMKPSRQDPNQKADPPKDKAPSIPNNSPDITALQALSTDQKTTKQPQSPTTPPKGKLSPPLTDSLPLTQQAPDQTQSLTHTEKEQSKGLKSSSLIEQPSPPLTGPLPLTQQAPGQTPGPDEKKTQSLPHIERAQNKDLRPKPSGKKVKNPPRITLKHP